MVGKNQFLLNQETMCEIVEYWLSSKMSGPKGIVKEVKADSYYKAKTFTVTIQYPGGAPPEEEVLIQPAPEPEKEKAL